ncbi:MAG TPA: hypothetical protein VEK07_11515 [Polyangiaceae bacterium]|nr:hypothetical protein [Polyangiaceae bacterium]
MSGGGTLESSVTLEEVFAVLRARRVPLAPELAGYLVLEVAQHADPGGGDVDPRSVFIGEEGTVALVKPKRDAALGNAETSVRAMLANLLEASGSQTPALAAASKRKSGGGLHALADELETALVPVNRAAGRRALARLAREVRRVTLGVGRNALPSWHDSPGSARRGAAASHGPAAEPSHGSRSLAAGFSHEENSTAKRPITSELLNRATPAEWTDLPTSQFEAHGRARSESQADVDSLIERFAVPAGGAQHHSGALKAMAGLEPTPPPSATAQPNPASDAGVDEISALLRSSEPASPPAQDSRQLTTQPSQLRRARASISTPPRIRRTRLQWFAPVLGLLAIAAGAYAALRLRISPTNTPAAPARPAPPIAPVSSAAPTCRGTLVVSNVPARAEVLLRQGQAPLEVERMPVGARLEFVATAEGYAPKRLVVPASASWDNGPDGKPRLETAVQLDPSKAGTDPWPAGEPGSEVGGQGPPGTVRIVSTPRGAEIWLLAGISPDARVEQLRCDHDWDVLVAGPTTFRRRLHLEPRDFQVEDSTANRIARVTAK